MKNLLESPQFKEQISNVNHFPERNSTTLEKNEKEFGKDSTIGNKTTLEVIEERILKAKLEQALKTLDSLNKNAKYLLKSKDSRDLKEMRTENGPDFNLTQTIK